MGLCEGCEKLKKHGSYVSECGSGLCLHRRAKVVEALKIIMDKCLYCGNKEVCEYNSDYALMCGVDVRRIRNLLKEVLG